MSDSSPEQRYFIAKPSPLHTQVEGPLSSSANPGSSGSTVGYRNGRKMNISQATTNPGVHVVSPPPRVGAGPPAARSDVSAAPRGSRNRQALPSETAQRRDSSHRRRANSTGPGARQYDRSPQRAPSRSQHGSLPRDGQQPQAGSGGFRAAGLSDLVETPDVNSTLNPGRFDAAAAANKGPRARSKGRNSKAPETRGGNKAKSTAGGNKAPPEVENILDRSPTPPLDPFVIQQSQQDKGTSPSYVSARERRPDGGEPSRAGGTRTRKSIEEALGIEINEPGQAIAKTFVRPEPPLDLLEYPVIFNPRVSMMVSITQPLYIGGGCVDGRLNIHIRGTNLDDIRLGRVSIDIAGVEELSFTRKTMFMSLASELIDEDHPPPAAMLEVPEEDQKLFWKVKPSRSFLPFKLRLPLNVGPPPFHSLRARIRYVIHGTIMILINGNKSIVRSCRDIRIISALDPETALLPLETPLLSTEEHTLRYGGHNTLKVTAGLHRAVWIAGTAAYVDVNIVNNTNRHVKKIKCKLRRHILAYKNTVALAENQNAGHLRVPSWIERKTLSHSELNIGSRWKGVKGSQLDVITCEIEIPRNQSTVKMGRYFEVKYLIDIAVCTPAARTVRVQLPVTIVHMNSLDIVPNDLPDVAVAIADQYGREAAKSFVAGRAFSAPREHVAASKLPAPLVPSMQPQKPSGTEPSEAPKGTEPDFDLSAFAEGGFTQGGTMAGYPTPARPKDFWEQQQEEYEDKARKEAAAAAAAAERRNPKAMGRMTAKEMLKQLERLKQV